MDTPAYDVETRYREVVELSPDSIFIGRDYRLEYANPAALRLLGAPSAASVLGRSPFELIHPDSRPQLARRIDELVAGQSLSMTEEKLVRVDGTIVDVELTGTAFEDSQGRALIVIVRDIGARRRTETALRESEERLRLAFAGAQEGVWDWNLETGEVVYSAEWKRMLGYTDNEVEPHVTAWIRLIHPEDRDRVLDATRQVVGGDAAYDTEFRMLHRDGHYIDVLSRGFAVRRDGTGPVVRLVGTHLDLTERKQAEAMLRRAHEELEQRVHERTAELARVNASLQREFDDRERAERARHDLLKRLLFVQEEERRRIARDMHDQFGEKLTALGLTLRNLRAATSNRPDVASQITELEQIVHTLDSDVEHLVRAVRPTALDDLGLHAALSNYVGDWAKRVGVTVEVHSSGLDEDRLPTEVETTLYRIAQEALTNVARHAAATRVSILLERRTDFVSLVVEDDGVGFECQEVWSGSGFGVLGMRERASLIGASLDVESTPGAGTSVIVRLAGRA